jgi:hypothetical protein
MTRNGIVVGTTAGSPLTRKARKSDRRGAHRGCTQARTERCRVLRSEDAFMPCKCCSSAQERVGKPGNEFDQIGLAVCIGLAVQATKMSFDRSLGDP